MNKTIMLDGREVRVEMSADTLRVYRKEFGRDLMKDMMAVKDELDLEMVENLFYVCAAACDPEIPPIDDWLKQYSPFALYQASQELIAMWVDSNKTTTQRKKKADR
jgi:hypothetical protein